MPNAALAAQIHDIRRTAEKLGDEDAVAICLLALLGNAGALRMIREHLAAVA